MSANADAVDDDLFLGGEDDALEAWFRELLAIEGGGVRRAQIWTGGLAKVALADDSVDIKNADIPDGWRFDRITSSSSLTHIWFEADD